MAIKISEKITTKLLGKHNVTAEEVEQCFANIEGKFLPDIREDHKSNPQTLWFIACTNMGRKLKVVFIPENGDIYIRSAFAPNDKEIAIYEKDGN